MNFYEIAATTGNLIHKVLLGAVQNLKIISCLVHVLYQQPIYNDATPSVSPFRTGY